jgi:predicted O-methyltransferase YrrM
MNYHRRVKSYLQYLIKAKSNLYIHSPFVFDFYNNVIRDKKKNNFYSKALINNNSYKLLAKSYYQEANSSGIKKKYGKLISRIINHYNLTTALELGTNVGIGTAYIAEYAQSVITIDKNEEYSLLAKSIHRKNSINNVEYIIGDIDLILEEILLNKKIDFVFADANHNYSASIKYFNMIKNNLHDNSIYIIDDINWSEDMNKAWNDIKKDKNVTISIDLYRMGILFFNPSLSKQNFILRY